MMLKGKTAVVTGATSGIGRATAKLFASEGANVVFCGRRKAGGEALERELRAGGYSASFVSADVCSESSLDAVVNECLGRYGGVDILFNNAGTSCWGELLDTCLEKDFDRVFSTNVKSMFMLTKKVLPYMLERKSGSIINTASLAGYRAVPGLAVYSASKGAVIQFTRSIAAEYGGRGVRANAILPGLIATEMLDPESEEAAAHLPSVPMGRMGTPEEIAYPALFLAGDMSSYVNGACLVVDGGIADVQYHSG